MKHYYGYTPDGKLWWTFAHSGGFPDDCNLDNPNCTHPLSVHLRTNYNVNQTHNETLQGIVKFECPCVVGQECACGCDGPCGPVCGCATMKRAESYCDGNGFICAKPVVETILGGSVISHDATVTRYPGQPFTVKLQVVAPDVITDGETATISSDEMLETGSATFTFTNGVTNEVTLLAPAQGITGHLYIDGTMIKPLRAFVKGYAT